MGNLASLGLSNCCMVYQAGPLWRHNEDKNTRPWRSSGFLLSMLAFALMCCCIYFLIFEDWWSGEFPQDKGSQFFEEALWSILQNCRVGHCFGLKAIEAILILQCKVVASLPKWVITFSFQLHIWCSVVSLYMLHWCLSSVSLSIYSEWSNYCFLPLIYLKY